MIQGAFDFYEIQDVLDDIQCSANDCFPDEYGGESILSVILTDMGLVESDIDLLGIDKDIIIRFVMCITNMVRCPICQSYTGKDVVFTVMTPFFKEVLSILVEQGKVIIVDKELEKDD